MKRLIFNADYFGKNNNFNRAVLNGCNNGFLRSAGIVANGEAYNAAINEIIPECPKLNVGISLNLTEGKALTKCENLTNENNYFNKNILSISKLCKNKKILKEIENELRAQIEKVINDTKITHIDSINNIHSIPEIFDITCKLAKENNVKYVISHNQLTCVFPKINYFLKRQFWINGFEYIIMETFNKKNLITLSNYNLKTNDFIFSTIYSEILDKNILTASLNSIGDKEVQIYVKLAPCSYLRNINDNHSKEFKITQDKLLEDNINRLGFDISNYQ